MYVISGLGVDKRVFKHIDFGAGQVTHIKWLIPCPKESIESYAQRLCVQITDPNPILIGLSFGGIIAVEISKLLPCKKIILFASVAAQNEIPVLYKWVGKWQLEKMLFPGILRWANLLIYQLFGIQDDENKALIKQILKDTDPIFFKWAIRQILNWKNNQSPSDIIRIHGSKDRLFPVVYNIPYDYIIKGAGHFMTMTHYLAINKILGNCLNK